MLWRFALEAAGTEPADLAVFETPMLLLLLLLPPWLVWFEDDIGGGESAAGAGTGEFELLLREAFEGREDGCSGWCSYCCC